MAKRKRKMPSYKKILIWAIACLIIFWFFICRILNFLSGLCDPNTCGWFILEPRAADWFAFWASFSGTIATVLLGVATLRLTEKIEDNKVQTEQLQKNISVVMKMPNMTCESVKLYSFSKGDNLPEFLEHFGDDTNFGILFQMRPAFPAYFEIKLTKYKLSYWVERYEKEGQAIKELKESREISNLKEEKDFSIANHKTFTLYLNVADELESWLNHFYHLHLKNTNATPYEYRIVYIELWLKCSNVLVEGKNAVEFRMKLTLEGEGEKAGCVGFKVNNLKLAHLDTLGA